MALICQQQTTSYGIQTQYQKPSDSVSLHVLRLGWGGEKSRQGQINSILGRDLGPSLSSLPPLNLTSEGFWGESGRLQHPSPRQAQHCTEHPPPPRATAAPQRHLRAWAASPAPCNPVSALGPPASLDNLPPRPHPPTRGPPRPGLGDPRPDSLSPSCFYSAWLVRAAAAAAPAAARRHRSSRSAPGPAVAPPRPPPPPLQPPPGD